MKTGIRYIVLISILPLLLATAAWGQKPIRSNFRADFCIPVITGNYALRTSFSEIVDINTSYHFTIAKKLTVGPAFSFTHFTIDSLSNPGFNTRMFILTPGLDIGYQTFMGDNSIFTGSVQVGYSLNRFTNVFSDTSRTPTGYNTNALSIEPMLRFYFFTGDRVALGFKVSYKMIFQPFNYRDIYLEKYQVFTDKQSRGNIGYFNAGLVFLIGTSKRAFAILLTKAYYNSTAIA
ncbi:MAG: hypothetical protein M0D57_18140 [Sphingobacteriales bacterium JAD_PAG50586_3]|nr:MAG: hypothetical protein M0D57_18140 [Sphingobacteriales bacterium JAD_PAG50586_3]